MSVVIQFKRTGDVSWEGVRRTLGESVGGASSRRDVHDRLCWPISLAADLGGHALLPTSPGSRVNSRSCKGEERRCGVGPAENPTWRSGQLGPCYGGQNFTVSPAPIGPLATHPRFPFGVGGDRGQPSHQCAYLGTWPKPRPSDSLKQIETAARRVLYAAALAGDRRTMEIAQAVLIFVCEVSPREVHGS